MKRCPKCKALNSDAADQCEKCNADIKEVKNTMHSKTNLIETEDSKNHMLYYVIIAICFIEFVFIANFSSNILFALVYVVLVFLQLYIEFLLIKYFSKIGSKVTHMHSDFLDDTIGKMNDKK